MDNKILDGNLSKITEKINKNADGIERKEERVSIIVDYLASSDYILNLYPKLKELQNKHEVNIKISINEVSGLAQYEVSNKPNITKHTENSSVIVNMRSSNTKTYVMVECENNPPSKDVVIRELETMIEALKSSKFDHTDVSALENKNIPLKYRGMF